MSPHLKKVGVGNVTFLSSQNLLVYDFDQYGTKVVFLVVVATGDDFVQLMEGHLEHHIVHEVLGGPHLVVYQLVFLVRALDLL